MEAEYENLLEHAQDCCIFYGWESPQYEKAIKELNNYLLAQEQKQYDALTFFQKMKFNKNYNKKNGHSKTTD